MSLSFCVKDIIEGRVALESKAHESDCPPSTHQRDRFVQECFDEAEKQWAYKDLVIATTTTAVACSRPSRWARSRLSS
jgi:hypothetical protein